MVLQDGQHGDGPTLAVDSDRLVGGDAMTGENGHVLRAHLLLEAVTEADVQALPGEIVHIDVDTPALVDGEGAEVVDAVGVIGVVVRVDNAIELVDALAEQLVAQVR